MQYKIPVQIENEDPIILGLSIRQLAIVGVFGGIGYAIFSGLYPITGGEIAGTLGILFPLLGAFIAKFSYAGMTFMQSVLAFIRSKANLSQRHWIKGVDSYSPMDIGYISSQENTKKEKIDFNDKIDKMREMQEKINKI